MDPATHAYPALQSPVHVDVVRPLEDPCRPESQGPLQLALDMVAVAPYRPVLQLVHTAAPAKLYRPAGQAAAVALVDPATHAYPALQSPVHVEETCPVLAP